MQLGLYRRLPIQFYLIVYLLGGCIGLQYIVPSRLYALKTRLLFLVLLSSLWWLFLYFHQQHLYLYRECVLFVQLFHYILSLFYLYCFGGESLLLLSSDIKDQKIELLQRWNRRTDWKRNSLLQV